MPPASASVLNPHAHPFHPRYDEPLDFGAVFNDGVPTAVLSGDVHPEHGALRSISDEALDEAFPPSANEAAEIDATMDFVLTMSYLDALQEQEERARNGFRGMGVRWEARREMGLVGRPHPARTDREAMPKNHHPLSPETSIVPFDKTHGGPFRPFSDMESMRSRAESRHAKKSSTMTKGKKTAQAFTRPIQQPRKQYR
uniref:Uncharacterized protein n=1 Tax=Trieres chinensis TaxID=1514140 RepID=A0A7S2E7G4_TRICV|mmetsp:Transcript_10780/g.22601  ORF Transcript_10780/g.22601 Transcript_10780/m.22601 type:complete len:199 (+) Transcript_10780:232-828(+)